MSAHACQAFQDRLVALVETGRELTPAELEAARSCPDCTALLESLEAALRPLPSSEPSADAVERAQREGGVALVRAVRVLRTLRLLSPLMVLALLWAGAFPWEWLRVATWSRADWAFVLLPLVASLLAAGRARDRGTRPARLHTHWDGHQIQGVCTGLGTYVGLPAWPFRLAFLGSALAGLPAITLYLLLSLGLSFSAEDRRHSPVFRCRRAMHRLRNKPDHSA